MLGGVHGGRPSLATIGACLAGVVVLAHAVALVTRVGRGFAVPAGGTV